MAADQETPDPAERFEQAALSKPERIDREKGEMYGVRVLGIKSAHGYDYTLPAQQAAAPKFEQMAVGIDHDYSGGPVTAETAWGVLFNPRVDDKGTLADLRYLKTHARTEQILEDIDRELGIFSMSPVTVRCVERPKGSVVSFEPVRCDLVVRGATTRKLFEQAAAETDALKAEVTSLKASLAEMQARQTKYEQYVAPKAGVQQAIEKVAAKIDLKKFWND